MTEYFESIRILDGKSKKVIVDDAGKIVNKNPSKEELKGLEEELYKNKGPKKYTKIQILEYIKRFYEEKRTIPIKADFDSNLELPSSGTVQHYFGGSWNNAIREAGLWNKRPSEIGLCPRIKKDTGKPCGRPLTPRNRCEERDKNGNKTGIWICLICYNRDSSHRQDSRNNVLKSIANSRTGNLDPGCNKAKGDLGEELTNRWRGTKNLNKENDNYLNPIDHSRDLELGIIQTKIAWYNPENKCWTKSWENEWYKEFDNIIIHCISTDGEIVERTYIIPSWEVISRTGIKIVKYDIKGNLYKEGWYDKYIASEEEMIKINEIWQEMLKEDHRSKYGFSLPKSDEKI